MKTRNKAFTFVELIVSVGIILLVSTVGYISYTGNIETKDNAKVSSDLATIDNSFKSYFAETKTLPEANGNKSFYKADGSYAHDETDSAYGVSSFVSEKTMSSKYLNSIPLDPRTGYYYAYGKTIDNKYYEIAGVEKKDNTYKAIVKGDYPVKGDELQNLVREYNGPEFVGNNSTNHFPYNPEEKLLTASIYDYSGSVNIIRGTQNYTGDEIMDLVLVTGDKIVATQNSTASIYFSDGSKSSLGDSSKSSELVLANMEYKEDNNLFTKVKLVLNIGTLWTSASKMSENSDFEVYSNDTVAAVRGTVFGVTVSPAAGTNVVVARGDVEVSKLTDTSMIGESLIDAIASNEDISYSPITSPSSVVTNSGHIIVESTDSPKGLQIISTGTPSSSTGSINFIPGTIGDREEILIGGTEGNEENIYLDIESLSNSGSYDNFKAKINISDKILKKFDYLKLNNSHTKNFTSLGIITATGYTLTGGIYFNKLPLILKEVTNISNILTSSSGKFDLVACVLTKKGEKCSKSKKFTVGEKMSFGEQEKAVLDQSSDTSNQIECTKTFGNESNVESTLCSQGYDLVAYAGYNNLGDLKLYTGIDEGIIPETIAVISSNGCTPKFDGTNPWFKINDCNSSSISPNNWIDNFSKNNGFFSLTNGVKGIFLDQDSNNDDKIQYTLPATFTSGTGFAIEMSVRGAALKRSGNYYNLFSIGNISLFINANTNKISLWSNSYQDFQNIEQSKLTSLLPNSFYKVIVIFSGNSVKFQIISDNGIIESQNGIDSGKFSSTAINSQLFIGSSNTKTEQWNDIIDYVKIYKK